jgi:hypothetical protein
VKVVKWLVLCTFPPTSLAELNVPRVHPDDDDDDNGADVNCNRSLRESQMPTIRQPGASQRAPVRWFRGRTASNTTRAERG